MRGMCKSRSKSKAGLHSEEGAREALTTGGVACSEKDVTSDDNPSCILLLVTLVLVVISSSPIIASPGLFAVCTLWQRMTTVRGANAPEPALVDPLDDYRSYLLPKLRTRPDGHNR